MSFSNAYLLRGPIALAPNTLLLPAAAVPNEPSPISGHPGTCPAVKRLHFTKSVFTGRKHSRD